MFGQVLEFLAVFGKPVERSVLDRFVADRNGKSAAEGTHLVGIELLFLMRRVATFARLAESIALDRLGENHGRRTLVMDCRIVRREYLSRIVSAAAHLQELFVRKVLRHGEQFGRDAEKMLANVSARLDAVFLILAVDDFAHAFDEPPVDVGF